MDINQRLTEELKKQILAAETLVAVEDLYRHIVQSAARRATIVERRKVLTGSDLMKCDDRISEKRYNDFMKSEAGGNIHENCDY